MSHDFQNETASEAFAKGRADGIRSVMAYFARETAAPEALAALRAIERSAEGELADLAAFDFGGANVVSFRTATVEREGAKILAERCVRAREIVAAVRPLIEETVEALDACRP